MNIAVMNWVAELADVGNERLVLLPRDGRLLKPRSRCRSPAALG